MNQTTLLDRGGQVPPGGHVHDYGAACRHSFNTAHTDTDLDLALQAFEDALKITEKRF